MKQIEQITQGLWDLQDCSYRDFQAKLIPTLDKEKIIGVRTPALRKYAKEVMHHPQAKAFLLRLPHTYYEENNLHGELLCLMYKKDLEGFLAQLEKYLPYIDNWATCDMLAPKVFCQNLSLVYQKIQTWLASEQEYTVRFGIVSLMRFYLDEAFQPEMLDRLMQVQLDTYYVNMALAWYYSMALVKQYEAVIPLLENHVLKPWVHNQTIQKACDSKRFSQTQKAYFKSLRWKG